MKILNLKEQIQQMHTGEFIIGSELTASHACYMIYGVLNPFERDRIIKPGKGHEEIVLILKGEVRVTGIWEGILTEGQAIHVVEEESLYFENLSGEKAIYIIAGGHSQREHHH